MDYQKQHQLQMLRDQLAQLQTAHDKRNHPMGNDHIKALGAEIERRIRQIETFTPFSGQFDPSKLYGIAHSRLATDFLDGNTFTGGVGFSPNMTSTGARWHINVLDDNPGDAPAYSFSTPGSGGIFHFLDGHTENSSVSLSPQTDLWYTGTRWKVFPMTDPVSGFPCHHIMCFPINGTPGTARTLAIRANKVCLADDSHVDGWWIVE